MFEMFKCFIASFAARYLVILYSVKPRGKSEVQAVREH